MENNIIYILILPYGVSFIIILLSNSLLAFLAASGDNVTSAEFLEVGEISNWIEQSFPVQPLSQKHWFKFEQIYGQKLFKHTEFIQEQLLFFRVGWL